MTAHRLQRLFVPIVAVAATWGVLSFYQPSRAQQRGPTQPFANSVQQRSEMVEHLKAIETLLTEQNNLLRSGKIKVVVEQSPAR